MYEGVAHWLVILYAPNWWYWRVNLDSWPSYYYKKKEIFLLINISDSVENPKLSLQDFNRVGDVCLLGRIYISGLYVCVQLHTRIDTTSHTIYPLLYLSVSHIVCLIFLFSKLSQIHGRYCPETIVKCHKLRFCHINAPPRTTFLSHNALI